METGAFQFRDLRQEPDMPDRLRPMTAVDDGEVVVFLIGMTFNRLWKPKSWWPVFVAMPKMLRELSTTPELGLLSSRMMIDRHGPTLVQYWRSHDHLEAFARAKDRKHLPAWSAFYKSPAASNGDVGIWHETFVTQPSDRETIYFATPRFGFADAAARVEPIGPGQETSRKRRDDQRVNDPGSIPAA
ncbi:MAG: DUF4188 domain-containing protein [Solirubrobacteraceae bacterium]|nr:DUF4188 domain-containing protein [Solirubrobacteraceae bacterium]